MTGEGRGRGWLVVAHHHPGRLRVRSPRFELDTTLLEATQRWLAEHPGVLGASADAGTGSILVAYDASHTDAGQLLVAIATRTRLVVVERARRHPPAKRVFHAVHELDALMLDASGGRFGLGVVFPAVLGAGSIASLLLSSHARAPRWDNLVWWGMQAFQALNEDQRLPRAHASGR